MISHGYFSKTKLKNVLAHMHSADPPLVHGDLRSCNIYVVYTPRAIASDCRLCLLDFDWSGRAGEALYPAFINKEVQWPETACPFKPLLPEHDRHFAFALGCTDV